MPLLFYSYLFSEMIAPFLASLAILTGVMLLAQLLQSVDTFLVMRIGGANFLRLTLYTLPKLMMFSAPLASMLGIILCFSRLNADNELLALRASGIGSTKILPPVIFFALIISLMAGYSSTVLMPKGLVNMQDLMLLLARKKVDRMVREQSFSSLGKIVAYVDQVDPATGHWHNVYLYDGRQKNKPVTVTARRGWLAADYKHLAMVLHLTDGSIFFLDNSLAQEIRFQQYSISLPISLGGSATGRAAKRTEMTGRQLLAAAKKYGSNSPMGRGMMIEYHQRLTLAAGCFILTLLGFPLAAAHISPGSRQMAVPIGLCCFLLYYLLFSFTETLAQSSGSLWAVPVLWGPNLFFLILTVIAITRMNREPHLKIIDFLLSITRQWPGFIRRRRRL